MSKASDFFTKERVIPWGKDGSKFNTFAECLSFINGVVQDAANNAANAVTWGERNADAPKKALTDMSVVPWGKQQVDEKGNRLKNEDGTDRVDTESVANSLSVTNGAALDARDYAKQAAESAARIEALLAKKS